MRKATKTIISFAVILIAGLNCIVPAFAQDPFTAIAVGGLGGASGAGLFGSMAAMSGINIGWSQSGADPLDAMWNVLNPDHVYFSGEKHEATGIDEDVWDYIKVDIGDWLQAQRDFITEFADQYEVIDNDSGNISIPLSYGGYAFDNVVGNYTGTISIGVLSDGAYSCGAVTVVVSTYNASYFRAETYLNNVRVNGSYVSKSFENYPLFWCKTGNDLSLVYLNNGITSFVSSGSTPVSWVSSQSVNWSSNKVDLDTFDDWESAKVKIPHDMSQLATGWTLPDFLSELDRIWTGAGEDNIVIENGSEDPPVPPQPIPSIPLGNVPFDDWVDLWGQGIYQQLENQSDALDFIGSNGTDAIEELESIDTSIQDLGDTAESIDTNIGIGNGILGGIRSLAQSAVNYLEGIAEHVGELVEEIVEGTETLIAGILNQIPQVFSVIFGPIKQASSIWHYVVEWIQSIGAPFQFIWSMASGTSYYIILPVYASLAAAVVLAFYKRFGK